MIAIGVWSIAQETRFVRDDPEIVTEGERSLSIAAVIPAGACTITDQPALTLLADRFVPDRSSCPDIVDTFSTWIAYDPNHLPPSAGPYDPALVQAWRTWLSAADYAVFSGPRPFRIPWPPELSAWFDQNYRVISRAYGAWVYQLGGTRPN